MDSFSESQIDNPFLCFSSATSQPALGISIRKNEKSAAGGRGALLIRLVRALQVRVEHLLKIRLSDRPDLLLNDLPGLK